MENLERRKESRIGSWKVLPETLTPPPGSLPFNLCSCICPVPIFKPKSCCICATCSYRLRRDCQMPRSWASWLLNYWWFEIDHRGSIFTPQKLAVFTNQGCFVLFPESWLPSIPRGTDFMEVLLPSNTLHSIRPGIVSLSPVCPSSFSLLGL